MRRGEMVFMKEESKMKKMQIKTVWSVLFAVVSLVAVISTAMLGIVWNRVRAFDHKHGSDVMAGMSPVDMREKAKTPESSQKGSLAPHGQTQSTAAGCPRPSVETNTTACVNAIVFPYSGGEIGTIKILFTRRPNVEDLRRGIQIVPRVEDVSIETDTDWPWFGRRYGFKKKYIVELSSKAFKFRTPYMVTVKKDLLFDDGSRLDREYRKSVERPDLAPSVSLAYSGRYLPSAGNRFLAVDCVNVSRVKCSAWHVLPENIVQLLAREERQYTESIGWDAVGGDSKATTELSAAPFNWAEEIPNKLNEEARYPLSLHSEHGIVSNGVYLLSIKNGDMKDKGGVYPEYRLVCVTDIGLSVRRDRYGLRVWVTSLSSGKPMANMEVKLYASNRLVLADRKTGSNGEVLLDGWDSRYEPFALVVGKPDRSDCSFMAIRDSMKIDEALPNGVRPRYLEPDECRAFVWTERGIYRHGEKIMVHAVLRNGRGHAPKPFPVVVRLEDAEEREVMRAGTLTDEYGAVKIDTFTAPDNRPSGKWKVKVLLPGKQDVLLGEREIKIEEFVPPQVRVKLKDLPQPHADVTNITYKVAAEHLFGGPAKKITAESLVSFTDVDFTPEKWKGFRFGDAKRGLKPNYTRLERIFTDERGEATFTVGMDPDWGDPKAAVRVTIQGSVFETGGRPSVTRESRVLHRYPYYIGTDIPRYIRQKPGTGTFSVVQVEPDGRTHQVARELKARLWKVEYVYNLVQDELRPKEYYWDSQQVRRPVEIDKTIQIGTNGVGSVKLPLSGSGDYELSVEDEERGLSHTATFWISAYGDDEVRASLKNPTAVSISADKSVYREGDRPRLTLKCPFRGSAWLSVMREQTLYTRVFQVTNLTQVVELDPVDGAWAPNVDVSVSLVQSVEAGRDHLACRAHGIASLRIRTRDSELPVKLVSSVTCADRGGSELKVKILSKGDVSAGERAVITVVDEGINILTNEKVPDPIGGLSVERGGRHPLYDIYRRLLPVIDSSFKANGVKTGGDDLAGMMNRVSPVPTRRFRPLSHWQFDVPLTNGVGEAHFRLPEFVGEVRITAFVYNRRGTGCTAVHQKVSPKLVMLPDAPRFAAPGDAFSLTLSLFNRSGAAGEVEYEILADGAVALADGAKGRIRIEDGGSKVLQFPAVAKSQIGHGVITYRTKGLGETHVGVIELPVRPAVPWEEHAEVVVLRPGEKFVSTNLAASGSAACTRRSIAVSGSPVAELKSAFGFLSEYPHGCLEQTTSRMFPLLYGIGRKQDALDVVNGGVARVVSMLRETDFTMWPDCNCPPWDREVSLYASHFLIEAGTVDGVKIDGKTTKKVCSLLKRWAYDADTNISVYACHTLALAGKPEKDRMFTLYDLRDRLPLLARARLARAFVRVGDPRRARELVADGAVDPGSVREAAFALLALLEMDSGDRRLGRLVLYLQKNRDRRRFHWGTTGENAHALLALGAYYRANGVREGEARVRIAEGSSESYLSAGATRRFTGGGDIGIENRGAGDAYVSLHQFALPEVETVTNRHHVVKVSRRFMTSEGFEADLANLTRGELLIGEITLMADRDYDFSDLVVQEFLPACFEPDRKEVAAAYGRCHGSGNSSWVLRSDVRDDRVTVFSRPFRVHGGERAKGNLATFHYAVRVITPGSFTLPGTSVEAMYAPEINARIAPGRLCVKP